jgi:hypothetical protein
LTVGRKIICPYNVHQPLNLRTWKCHVARGEGHQVTFAFGHDFRVFKLLIVERGTGRQICQLSTENGLTEKEVELCARVIRQAPVMAKALQDAENRLRAAKHPNAVALRQMIHSALRGLEEPLTDEPNEGIKDI